MPTATTVSATLGWTTDQATSALLLLRVADAPGHTLVDEVLDVQGAEVEDPGTAADGSRPVRLHATGGPVRLRYRADLDLEAPQGSPESASLPTLADLDIDLVPWTFPSRFCPSDVLGPTAEALFGREPRTGALLETVRAWVQEQIAYVLGSSDAETAADETFLRRAGVCRDLVHVTVALLRGLSVPARMVAGYALDLRPQDFHSVVEAHDGHRWRLLDATGLAPVDTIARIATGRDAADVAWGTTMPGWWLNNLVIEVQRR